MYVCLFRDTDGDVTFHKFTTLIDMQEFLSAESLGSVETINGISDGETISSGDEEETLAIVFKATDLIVETQRVTLREPVTLE